MARTGFFHHVGSFLLLAATVLLLVTTISSPVVHDISLLRVTLNNATSAHDTAVTFGTFGYCLVDPADGHDICSPRKIGYSPAAVVRALGGADSFSDDAAKAARGLTKVMVLHPVATGILFVAFLLAAGAGVVGSFLGALVALLAFVVTLLVLITDVVLFRIVRDHASGAGAGANAKARFGVALWTLVAAAVCTVLGTVVVFFSCCSARLHRQVSSSKAAPGSRRRRWF